MNFTRLARARRLLEEPRPEGWSSDPVPAQLVDQGATPPLGRTWNGPAVREGFRPARGARSALTVEFIAPDAAARVVAVDVGAGQSPVTARRG